jgi:hypothetical protein
MIFNLYLGDVFGLIVCVFALQIRRERTTFIVNPARWVEWLFGCEILILEMRTSYGPENIEFTKVKSVVVRNKDERDANVFGVQSKYGEKYIWRESNRIRGEQDIHQDLNAVTLWKELGDRNGTTDNPKYTPILKNVGVGLKKPTNFVVEVYYPCQGTFTEFMKEYRQINRPRIGISRILVKYNETCCFIP